ncbi:hypothetical protein GCM10022278_05240 [Allohahella marinimesophila]|uniref:Uncharacterized protein n=1 Tax=Allohahella marinimesophila TaxID=1054972 RepID=A0ABP7NKB9_9GAMM
MHRKVSAPAIRPGAVNLNYGFRDFRRRWRDPGTGAVRLVPALDAFGGAARRHEQWARQQKQKKARRAQKEFEYNHAEHFTELSPAKGLPAYYAYAMPSLQTAPEIFDPSL